MAAIYMWFVEPSGVYTTTLYPIEIIDGLQMSGSLGSGNALSPIPTEKLDTIESLVSGTLQQILKSTPMKFEALDTTESLVSGLLQQILKTTPMKFEALDTTEKLVSGYLDLALVTGMHPDEGLIMEGMLDTAFCSMTPV